MQTFNCKMLDVLVKDILALALLEQSTFKLNMTFKNIFDTIKDSFEAVKI